MADKASDELDNVDRALPYPCGDIIATSDGEGHFVTDVLPKAGWQ